MAETAAGAARSSRARPGIVPALAVVLFLSALLLCWLQSMVTKMAASADPAALDILAVDPRWQVPESAPGTRPWTDGYSHIFGVLKW